MPKAIYIHIPFCNRICPYCDFTKTIYKGQPVVRYIQAVAEEMKHTFLHAPPTQIESIFVGGGTPTSLDHQEMSLFLQLVNDRIQDKSPEIEFTVEVNPESIDEQKLLIMREMGVNRLSLGVQTFDMSLLKGLGRLHSPEDVYRAIEAAKRVGFTNISMDLMFGLPQQTLASFEDTLTTALSFDVPHFSAYSLKVEEGTFFYRLEQKNKLNLPTEETEFRMYQTLIHRLTQAGYEHYEISNFARQGFQSKHNLTYWYNHEYYGFGAGAHGYVKGVRHVNSDTVQDYIDLVQKKGLPYVETHTVTVEEAMENMLILGLRLKEGVSKKAFHTRFAVHMEEQYGSQLKYLQDMGLIEQTGDRYHLTTQGIFLGNEVFAKFLSS